MPEPLDEIVVTATKWTDQQKLSYDSYLRQGYSEIAAGRAVDQAYGNGLGARPLAGERRFVGTMQRAADALYVPQGYVKNSYDMAVAGYSGTNNSRLDRALNFVGATLTYPLAMAEEFGRGVANIPHGVANAFPLADQAGALFGAAFDSSLPTSDRIIAGLGGVRDSAFAFTGLGAPAAMIPSELVAPLLVTESSALQAARGGSSVEQMFQQNSLRLADEGHSIFTQGVANGDIALHPRLSLDIQRGGFVDEYTRQGNIVLRSELGLDASTVRINQRLYAPNGKYSVPDIHFPTSGNSIDYSYQLKSATTPQIMRIQQAAPNGTITIIPPSVIRPVYTIGK